MLDVLERADAFLIQVGCAKAHLRLVLKHVWRVEADPSDVSPYLDQLEGNKGLVALFQVLEDKFMDHAWDREWTAISPC